MKKLWRWKKSSFSIIYLQRKFFNLWLVIIKVIENVLSSLIKTMLNININDLSITTLKGRKLLDSFSFNLNEGDKIALIGEEGNGKSTLLKIIAGIDVSNYVSYSGTIKANGKIGYLPQKIEDEYLDKTTIEYIGEDIDYNFLYSLIVDLNIDANLLEDRIVRSLSGGEKVKIALLKILYEQANILLLDEPTNDLDLKTLIWLEEFIKSHKQPIIFISHDETLLENCANGILHLEQFKRKSESKITFSGNTYKEYISYRDDFINHNNMVARKQRKELDKQLEKFRQIYQKVDHAQATISRQDPHGAQLLKKKIKTLKAQEDKFEIKKENLTKIYEPEEAIDIFFEDIKLNPNKVILDLHLSELKIDDRVLSKNINLHVLGKDKICIIGSNGAGKSTLIKKIYNELINREDIKLGYMPQNYYELMNYDISPIDYLMINREYKELSKVQSYLGALRFTSEEMSHKIIELSEGQKCKILLIKMILDGSNVLLLDEPSRNLSPLSNPVVRNILNEFKGSIISVSHDRKFIEEVIEDVYELNEDGLKHIY